MAGNAQATSAVRAGQSHTQKQAVITRRRVSHGEAEYPTSALRISRERFQATVALAKFTTPLRLDLPAAIDPPHCGLGARIDLRRRAEWPVGNGDFRKSRKISDL
jgi:hypothetical protein